MGADKDKEHIIRPIINLAGYVCMSVKLKLLGICFSCAYPNYRINLAARVRNVFNY